MKEYQQKRKKSFVLPEPVYRQALWAVKDLSRMKERLKEMDEKKDQTQSYQITEGKYQNNYRVSDRTGNIATDLVAISTRISAIEEAFNCIPEMYRKGIREKLVYNIPYGDEAHPNTWKKWQQVYLFYVAANLNLM